MNKAVLVAQGLVSAYGHGVAACFDGLMGGTPALAPAGGSFAAPLAHLPVACARLPVALPDAPLGALRKTGPLPPLLRVLFGDAAPLPPDAALYVATTVGEIGLIEQSVFAATPYAGGIGDLAPALAAALGLDPATAQTVSSACASSAAALALAAGAIAAGEISCAVVVGYDCLSEFVLSGFAALMAVDPDGARPFDANRRGMSVGEAAAFAVLMSGGRAAAEKRPVLGEVRGWGMTCDANHLTGPSRDGAPLAAAINDALAMARCAPAQVAAIAAHGTGTPYNDQMEMLALRRVFAGQLRPLFSVKGGMGHTLGAAGLVGALLGLEALRRGIVPPTVGLRDIMEDAAGWAAAAPQPLAAGHAALATASGFGGINTALVLTMTYPPGKADGAFVPPAAGTEAPGLARLAGEFAPPRNLGRFTHETRDAFQALAAALLAAGYTPDANGTLRARASGAPARVGVIAHNRRGSAAANLVYFSDYVSSGRTLGRGQLFAATLPTSVAAECAIACKLTGPLLYVAQADGSGTAARRAAATLLAHGAADAMTLLHGDAPDGARATVLKHGEPERPNQCI